MTQLIFGKHTLADAEKMAPRPTNPCLSLYGEKLGYTCKNCKHLTGGRFHKCDLRKMSQSATTDHRVNWPACKKWEACHR